MSSDEVDSKYVDYLYTEQFLMKCLKSINKIAVNSLLFFQLFIRAQKSSVMTASLRV